MTMHYDYVYINNVLLKFTDVLKLRLHNRITHMAYEEAPGFQLIRIYLDNGQMETVDVTYLDIEDVLKEILYNIERFEW